MYIFRNKPKLEYKIKYLGWGLVLLPFPLSAESSLIYIILDIRKAGSYVENVLTQRNNYFFTSLVKSELK